MKKTIDPATPIVTEEEEIEVVKEESTGKKILNTVVNVVLVLAIALAAVSTYVSYVSASGNGVPSILGIRMFSIQTESMYPTLNPGDLIFDKAVKDPATLQKGDIITYWTVINGERVLNTHRIHEIYDGGGYLIFGTKGDNNTIADPLTVHESEVVGIYAAKVGGVGKVFDYLQTSTGFLVVVVVPVFVFFLYYLVQFFRVLFEYQNVKNRIKYEQERGRNEDILAEAQRQQQLTKDAERAALEAELREKLKAELLASMAPAAPPAAPAVAEAPVEQPAEEPVEQPPEQSAEEVAEEVTDETKTETEEPETESEESETEA